MAKVPEKVGKYKILSQIGKGGMGVVYSAEHPTLKRKIILKKLTIRDKEFRERFRLEADMMMDLRSDYIVDMYDHFREGSSWYIAMEYIEGMTLEELIKRDGQPELPLVLYIMLCTAKALEYIHSRGIVHRDIKPANIYISRSGEVKLGDFGIASSSGRDVKITDSGAAMGTPAYMAPEQFDDSSTVGVKADLFSFGVTLYEALCGIKPFRSGLYTELKAEILRGKFPAVKNLRKDVPAGLNRLLRSCLRTRPLFRPRQASDVRRALERESGRATEGQMKERLSAVLSEKPEAEKARALTEMVLTTSRKAVPLPLIKPAFLAITALSVLILPGLFLSGRYGLLNISVIPAVEDSGYELFLFNSEQTTRGRLDIKGRKKLILREGSYRVRIESGSTVLWRSVYVMSLKKSGKAQALTVLAAAPDSLPIDLDISVRDRFTGKDLTEETDIFIGGEDRWIPFHNAGEQELRTGTPFKFKFSKEGYQDEIYAFDSRHYQTFLDLDILLSPRPAELTIDPRGGKILINGKKEYFSLETLLYQTIPAEGSEPVKLRLLPGTYSLSRSSSDGDIRKDMVLKSDGKYNFP
ncbi:MAG: serine/threonine protein kinase [Spirochaetales bacterium]|nr:serine/threonine protein kinase [Spirochaetales bacterium]